MKPAASLWFILLPQLAWTAVPSVSYLYPAGGSLNSTNTVTLSGVDKSWPLRAWTGHPQLSFSPLEKAGQMTVSIGPEVPPGPHLIHFMNSNGVSSPKIFLINHLPEIDESEPNDAFRQAQTVTNLPVTINGKLNKKGDVDSFMFHIEKGQSLLASVDAYNIDSPMDAVLHLKDSSGASLAFNHDWAGLDPLLSYQATTSQNFMVQLAAFGFPPQANVSFTGSDSCVYRLTLITASPAGNSVTLDALSGRPPFIAPSTNSFPQILEQEPNQAFTNAPLLKLPLQIQGRIDPNGDIDRYRFQTKKGDIIVASLSSENRGSPVDGVLQIENSSGKSLTRADDTDKRLDPALTWKSPEDGIYALVVSDLYKKGGSNHVYHLEISHGLPDFELSLKANSLVVEAGKTLEIKATVDRQHGHTNEIRIIADNLPSGVTMEEGSAPEKSGEVTLKLIAAKDAAPSQQPIRIYGASQGSGPEEVIQKDARIPLKGKTTEAGDLLINETPMVWLTILPAQTAPPSP